MTDLGDGYVRSGLPKQISQPFNDLSVGIIIGKAIRIGSSLSKGRIFLRCPRFPIYVWISRWWYALNPGQLLFIKIMLNESSQHVVLTLKVNNIGKWFSLKISILPIPHVWMMKLGVAGHVRLIRFITARCFFQIIIQNKLMVWTVRWSAGVIFILRIPLKFQPFSNVRLNRYGSFSASPRWSPESESCSAKTASISSDGSSKVTSKRFSPVTFTPSWSDETRPYIRNGLFYVQETAEMGALIFFRQMIDDRLNHTSASPK